MDMQRARIIIIATLTAISGFILASPLFAIFFCSEAVADFSLDMLTWACFAVIPFAILVFAAMWNWSGSSGWKLLIIFLHVIFACAAVFWTWFLWFFEFHMIP